MLRILVASLLTLMGLLFVQTDSANAQSRREKSDEQSYSKSQKSSQYRKHARSHRHGHKARTAHAKRHKATRSYASNAVKKANRSSLGASPSDTERPRRQRSIASTGGGGSSSGMASFYWQPQRVASGGWFNPNAMTAAHKTLPFGTKVRGTHAGNGRSVVVTINDRGPYIGGRVIDLSKAAAGVINMQSQGVAPVRLEILGR